MGLKGALGSLSRVAVPWIFALTIVALAVRTDEVKRATTRLVLFAPPSEAESAEKLLPPTPRSLSQAFALGEISSACVGAGAFRGAFCPVASLSAAKKLLGRDVTTSQLLGMGQYLELVDSGKSISDRMMGIFSFVNIIWFASIIGILVTIGPVLSKTVGPLLAWLCMATWQKAFVNVIKPSVLFLHSSGMLMTCCFLIATALVRTALEYPPAHRDSAVMIAFSGALAFFPCWCYNAFLFIRCKDTDSPRSALERLEVLSNVFMLCILAPVALLFQSQLVGFFAVCALFAALGFTSYCTFFGYCVGFTSDDAVGRGLVVSGLIILAYAALLVSGSQGALDALAPFRRGIMVMGSTVYFLALLCKCSHWNLFLSNDARYREWNAFMFASLLLYTLMGSVWGAPALTNTAVTFAVLWALEKELECTGMNPLGIFLLSISLYVAAYVLHAHPGFILTLFDPSLAMPPSLQLH